MIFYSPVACREDPFLADDGAPASAAEEDSARETLVDRPEKVILLHFLLIGTYHAIDRQGRFAITVYWKLSKISYNHDLWGNLQIIVSLFNF